MANISHFTQTVNGVSTTYDIHDANAVPRSGGAVLSGAEYSRTVNDSVLYISGGTTNSNGGTLELYGIDHTSYAGYVSLIARDSSNRSQIVIRPDGSFTLDNNGTRKSIAKQEDVIPRSGGAVMTGGFLGRTSTDDALTIGGADQRKHGGNILLLGVENPYGPGAICIIPVDNASNELYMWIKPDGTWTWTGQAVQLVSDQRLKQQIAEIDDKLLDAWEDVDLVQFKYNDAVDQKKDNARLHTGYVVQQIQKACEEHGVDVSAYGLYCHEQYPEETEEVEVEQADGTKTKEKKVIREASEHYSLRYTEALIVECKYLRRCIERLTARIEELEKGNNSK